MASKMVDLTGDSDSELDVEGASGVSDSSKINSIFLPKSVDKPMKHVPSFGIDKKQNMVVPGEDRRDMRDQPFAQASQVVMGSDLQQNKLTSHRFTYY